MIRLNPYLGFINNARQAMEFYKTIFGGKLTMSTFKEGMGETDPVEGNKIMHAMLETDNGMVIMASDAPKGMEFKPGSTISISLSGDDDVMLQNYWDKLREGGVIRMPYAKAPWGDTFGMLTDKFGIEWMVNAAGKRV